MSRLMFSERHLESFRAQVPIKKSSAALPQHVAGDHDALDLAGALADGAELGIAVHAFYVVLGREAVATVELDRTVGGEG